MPDARRAEIGNSSHLATYLLKTSLDYLAAVEAGALEAHVLRLGGRLHRGLEDLGLALMTPAAAAQRGPNVAFAHPAAGRLAELAAGEGILLWGEAGRLRASIHLFVTEADVARYLAWLPDGLCRVSA